MTNPDEVSDNRTGAGGTGSEFSGTAGDVVQARDVHGGVHIHGPGGTGPNPATPRQLPGDVRGFVNRQAELEHLDAVLAGDPAEPLVAGVTVVTGMAGVGKTTLALHWAHQVQACFPDGQLYLNLHGYDLGPPVTATEALDHCLRALGVLPNSIPQGLDARAALYRSLLAGRRVLVVLDNAFSEHQVRPLLPGTAGSLALVTSRSRLGGLTAREGAHRVRVDVLTEDQAVRLIRAVTARQRPDDQPSDLAELAELCARLPLALRIAAERAADHPRMTVAELVADLRDESALWDVLATGDNDGAEAVRTVFAWSYRALSADAARAFRLLGLHPGPDFSAEAVAALTGLPLPHTRRILETLLGAHLVEEPAHRRYQLHDLLRVYAADQARTEETPETRHAAIRRCVSWYLRTLVAAQKVFEPSELSVPQPPYDPAVVAMSFADSSTALHWFHTERANLVAVVRSAEQQGMDDLVWRFPPTLTSFYHSTNLFDDWFATGRWGLDAARRSGERDGEARNLESLGMACRQAGRTDEGIAYFHDALEIRRDLGDRYGEAMTLTGLGLIELRRRQPAARELFQQAREIFRALGEEFWAAQLATNLADAHINRGDPDTAEPLIQEALPVFHAHGERGSEAGALVSLGRIALDRGRPQDALPLITQALDIAQQVESPIDQAYWLLDLAAVQRALGRADEALVSCQESAVLHRRLGDRTREALAWDGTGCAYQDLDRPEDAAPFHRMAAATHRDLRDAWNEANALAHLAEALAASGNAEAAATHRQRAIALLAAYDDPRSQRLLGELSEDDPGPRD